MNITYCFNTLQEGKGIPNRVAACSEQLARLGENVSIVTFNKANRRLPDNIIVKEPVLFKNQRLPFVTVDSKNMFLNSIASRSLSACFRELNSDVVCVDYTPLDRFVNKLKQKSGFKVLYTYHGVADPLMYKGAERKKREQARETIVAQCALSDFVVAVSEYTKNELKRHGIQSEVVPNGVDRSFFCPDKFFPNFEKKNPVLVYIGRYTEHKGVLNLLEAFRMVKTKMPETVLYMFARYESRKYVEKIKRFIKDNRLEKSVFMFRDIYGELVSYIYNMADIFVSGALDETFGMTFVEAAACGTPSAAFASKSIPEVVEHGKTGLLSDPGDCGSMADNIVALLSDKKRLNEYSLNAVEFSKKYDWQVIGLKLQKILRKIQSII
ncbi:glycosyltransferase family 4 protein [bacterium]|nr:glycosyltransferase family 4 protein [bacterium]